MSRAIFKEEAAAPATPASTYWVLYAKPTGLWVMDDTGAELQVGGKDSESKAIIVENPSNAEDLSFFFSDVAITITKIRAVLVGSDTPSVTFTLRHHTDRSAVGSEVVIGGTVVTSTTTGVEVTSFNDATVVANSHVWLETTAMSGTVAQLILTVFYDED